MKDCVKAAQAAGKQGKTAPAGGGKTTMPKGDGLKTAWATPKAGKTPMEKAKVKVRN